VALVIAVLLVGLLTVMAMTMLNLSYSDYQVATNESRSIQALYNADAGVEEAKMRISPNAPTAAKIPIGTPGTWRAYILSGYTQAQIQAGLDPTHGKAAPDFTATESTSDYTYYATVQTGTSTIQWGWARIQHKVDASGNIVYQNAATGANTTAASQTLGGVTVYNPPILVVTAEGIQGQVRRMISVEYQPIVSTTTTTTNVVTNPFANAVHAKGKVELIGNAWTDSYDSRNGAYNAGGNKGSNGDVSTDATAAASILLTGGSTVNGDAYVGPGGNPATGITNGGTITGTQGTEGEAWVMPLSAIPAGVTNQGALSITGNSTRTLNEGTYWFSSLNISGNGRLVINGAVKIYVTGSIAVGGNGVATAGNLPPNLLMYGTVDPNNSANKCTSVSVHGNGNFYGSIYAPEADMQTSGNGAVYGALTGKTVKINGNAGFHYDEALGNIGSFVTTSSSTAYTTTGYSRYSWREIAF
jgi:hypothetical protein